MPEHARIRATVDTGGVLEFFRDIADETSEHQNFQGHAESRVNHDQAEASINQPLGTEKIEERNDHGLLRQHDWSKQEHQNEDSSSDWKSAESVGRNQGQQNCQHR